MRSAAAAIAWEFRQRHRWGLIILGSYLIIIATARMFVLEPGQPVHLNDTERFALVVVVPLTATFTYFLAVFSFGFAGDLAARQSMYPARMFTLPVTTAALAGWPMLYGSVTVMLLWLITRLFTVWPSGFDVPIVWPALLAAAVLAWTQALTWMPYGLPGLRVIVAVLLLAAIDTVVLLAIHYKAPESVMAAGLMPLIPLAYFTARAAVASARRGDVPDWRGAFARTGQMGAVVSHGRHDFSSPLSAHLWFEWRWHGRSLPVLVWLLLPFELALLFLAARDSSTFVELTLCAVLLTPPCMAAFAAATVRKSSPQATDSHGLTPFVATRPLTSAALVGAKLTVTIWSTVVTWLLVAVAIPLALVLSGTGQVIIDRMHWLSAAIGTSRAIVLTLLVLAGLMLSTWKQLVRSLYVGMSGREWIVKASVVLSLAFLTAIGPIAQWIFDSGAVRAAIWNAFPWILGALACLRTIAAAWLAARVYRSRVLEDRTLVIGAACWLVAVLVLHGLLVWLVPALLVPRYLLALVAILAIPLTRISAAPLALAWNRHR